MKARFLIPFFVFVALVALFFVGLGLNPREINSPLINKPAPAFKLPLVQDTSRMLSVEDMRGQVWLLNVWATWCSACREEHATLVEFAQSHKLPIVGLNYKEVRGDDNFDGGKLAPAVELEMGRARADSWLRQQGNPYIMTALDLDGRVGIDYGVYGVPETYLIDKQGIIRYKQIGPLTPLALNTIILPKAQELSR